MPRVAEKETVVILNSYILNSTQAISIRSPK